MSVLRRTLPERPSLEQQKKLARELLTAFQQGDPDAVARLRAALPDKRTLSLADAQFTLAREYGFESWSALTSEIEARAGRPSAQERFRALVDANDPTALRAELKRDAALRAVIDQPIFSFDSPAIVANNKRPEIVDALLDFGADPNRKSDWWAGGFHALYNAPPDVAERLLAAGAVPDACAAASMDRRDILERILREDPSRVHERGGDGQTPLHFARAPEIADLLLEAGADVDARDVDHRSTPAEWMVSDRHAVARHLVVERGAFADIFMAAALGLTDRVRAMVERDPSLLDLRTSQGAYAEQKPSSYHIYQWTLGANLSPLLVASKFGYAETVAVMAKTATDVQRLLLACHEGRSDDARAIVRAHPGIVEGLTGADRGAMTAEAWAANGPAVAIMMELGFDPAAPLAVGPSGASALHCAAWEGSVECVKAILAHPRGRALVNVKDAQFGGTPLGWCIHGWKNSGRSRDGYPEVERLLREAGAGLD